MRSLLHGLYAASLLALLLQVPQASGAETGATEAAADPAPHEAWHGRWGRRDPDADGEWESRKEQEIDAFTAKRLGEARDYMEAQQYDKANAALDRLRPWALNDFEKARALQFRAQIAFAQNDFSGARENLEAAFALDALPADQQAEVRFQIAQIYVAEENWSGVVENLEKWFKMVDSPNPSAYYLLGIAYFQMEDYDSALPPAEKCVELAETPQESWLQLLLALRLTRNEYKDALPVLDVLVRRFPSKRYLVTLSTVYGALGKYEQALIPLQLAYEQGMMTEDADLRRYAQLLLFLGLPYRAALVLEKGLEGGVITPDIEAWEMLGNSWIASRDYDKAVQPLTRAAELSQDGELFVRLARVHIQRENWSEAAAALSRGLERGGLENPGDAQLLMGIALYSQGSAEKARSWFARAHEHQATRDEAKAWLAHIDQERPAS